LQQNARELVLLFVGQAVATASLSKRVIGEM
jgi:hypothetical protein